uniref:F-box and leucine-rich repeat protein 2 n=1 Tax=Mus musculus TaxID=10090 RepID=D6RFC8_MOUSE
MVFSNSDDGLINKKLPKELLLSIAPALTHPVLYSVCPLH